MSMWVCIFTYVGMYSLWCPCGYVLTMVSMWVCTHYGVHVGMYSLWCPCGYVLTMVSMWVCTHYGVHVGMYTHMWVCTHYGVHVGMYSLWCPCGYVLTMVFMWVCTHICGYVLTMVFMWEGGGSVDEDLSSFSKLLMCASRNFTIIFIDYKIKTETRQGCE